MAQLIHICPNRQKVYFPGDLEDESRITKQPQWITAPLSLAGTIAICFGGLTSFGMNILMTRKSTSARFQKVKVLRASALPLNANDS